MPPVPLGLKAIPCVLLIFLLFPALQASAKPGSADSRGLDTLLRRAGAIHALSGLVTVKIHTPRVRKTLKAAFLLTRRGYNKIDGLSPFGSPLFHCLSIKNNLLLRFPGPGLLFMDRVTKEDLAGFMNFPVMEESLLEMVSGCLVNRRTQGEAVLMEEAGGKKFLVSIESEETRESRQMELNADFLPRRVEFLAAGKRLFTVRYSRYREVNGIPFPFYSLFQTPGGGTLEFHFKSVRRPDALPDEKFRVLLNLRETFIGRKDLLKKFAVHP